MAKVFLRRELIDQGEGQQPRFVNKFHKVVGELDELRETFSIITLNHGTDREVTILMDPVKLDGFHRPFVREADLTQEQLIRTGVLRWQDERLVHYMSGEIREEVPE
jgi:hypothetical protein